ncbi:MAG: DUF4445 domain-containing protein [Anaerofustis stercorihominis]|nr:DUF4445 domain-containing protein [Anaerofustis stercorihominis]
MAKYRVFFLPDEVEIFVEEGTTVLEAEIQAGLNPDAPCGGKGTCGKCLVEIMDGPVQGIVKACDTPVTANLTVMVPDAAREHSILMDGAKRNIAIKPIIKTYDVVVERCPFGESSSDWERVKAAVSKACGVDEKDIPLSVEVVENLYKVLNENDFKVNVVMCENEIIDIRANNDPYYVMAFDIGTTTVVGYLLDAATGEQKAVKSMVNPQSQYGADVIQRAEYALEDGPAQLAKVIRNALNELIKDACEEAGVDRKDLYLVSIVGNTCMHHLFAGISPGSLVKAPYNPAISEPMLVDAKYYSIKIGQGGKAMILPNIAGFVGADTIGVLLATEFDILEDTTLVIDIGTNGEMVLGNKERMVACSTAAGPAFEGAKIHCGMRGAEGAIDHCKFDGTEFVYSTIGGAKPIGICGSGLMDIIAALLEAGIVEDSGRMITADEADGEAAEANAHRIIDFGGKPAFVLAFAEEAGDGDAVIITQQDVREVQLAKSAMAAGIILMADTLGVKIKDIKKVMIAGAFGNYMDPQSACRIGLIPMELSDRIEPIGNAAGEGSKIAALNAQEFYRSATIGAVAEFVELATHPDFNDTYVDEMFFPEE